MSNDTVIFLDTENDTDGMLLLWGSWSDDDFLGGLWLAKKEKQNAKWVASNTEDETAVKKKDENKNHNTEDFDNNQTNEAESFETKIDKEIEWSVDAVVFKKAENPPRKTESKTTWYAKKSDYNWSDKRKERYSPNTANKVSFEQGKIAKKRDEKVISARPEYGQATRPTPTSNPTTNQQASTSVNTWEDRRKHATGQAVVFNRWSSWGQKIGGQSNAGNGPKKSHSNNEYKVSQTMVKKDEIVMGESITVKEFAEKMWVPIAEVIKKFIANKMLLSLNSSIDIETATLIAMEFDIKVSKESATAWIQDLLEGNLESILQADKVSETKEERPPIVTIMGHVDHGKTTLLDYLRKTVMASKEHGGITQSIGWSQIIHNNKKVTFIDTPGHSLFTSLRARGSKITDIVVIVVAADDGVMKQTVEAINHAKAANVPIIVAVTKIDKGIDNSEFIKTQLSEHGLMAEDRGWDVPIVKVSGVTGQGIDDLMDQILLHAEVSELVCDPDRNGIGVVLEAHKDIQKWVMVNMIMMTWTIKVGDILRIYDTFGKIKRIYNRKGQEVKSAQWWDPIMVLGINDVPEAGKLAESIKDEKEAKTKISAVIASKSQVHTSSIINKINEGIVTQANLIIKADSRGSLEALKAAIEQLELPETISFKVVHSDIGNFFDSDLDLGKASDALLVWFGITVTTPIKKKIDELGLTLKIFNIIYEITDYLEALAKGLIKHDPVEVQIGKLNVLWVFYRKGNDTIFGGKVMEGEVRNGSYFRIIRGEEIIDSGKITSLQKGQENVDKIWTGYECGMKARVSKKIEVGDVLEYYVME